MSRITVSQRFIERVKLGKVPGYRIAHDAGIHPATLSKLITGAERVKVNDPRVLAVGRVLGLSPAECFKVDRSDGQLPAGEPEPACA